MRLYMGGYLLPLLERSWALHAQKGPCEAHSLSQQQDPKGARATPQCMGPRGGWSRVQQP